jgi:hypothetical protein
MNMTLLHKHIAVVLLLAVFSLTTHAAIFHGSGVVDDHAQEQEQGQEQEQEHSHDDSETCIAGLAHAQLSYELHAPLLALYQVAVLPINGGVVNIPESLSVNPGRAPPAVSTSITA